jgi:hypothetical protein
MGIYVIFLYRSNSCASLIVGFIADGTILPIILSALD